MVRSRLTGGAVLAAGVCLAASTLQAQAPLVTSPFESYLELLRQQAGIPGMSAAIVQNGEIVWERGLGWQNVEARIRATPDTPYPIADITGTLAGTLVLECAEQRRVLIDRRHPGTACPFPRLRRPCERCSITPRLLQRAKCSTTTPTGTGSCRA